MPRQILWRRRPPRELDTVDAALGWWEDLTKQGESHVELKTGRRFLAIVVFAGGFGICLMPSRAQSNQNDERKNYAAGVRENYNFRFGKDSLSSPGNAAVDGDDSIQTREIGSQSSKRRRET